MFPIVKIPAPDATVIDRETTPLKTGFHRLLLVRPIKRSVFLACCFAVTASGTIQSITDLQPAQLVGTWEAVAVHLGLPTPGVYQILFSTPTEARFVAVLSPLPDSRPMFLGKLSSS